MRPGVALWVPGLAPVARCSTIRTETLCAVTVGVMPKSRESSHVRLDDWITPREAAELIGVTPYQVRHLARTGILEGRKFGYAWMISRASAEAYAASDRHPGPRPSGESSSD